MSSIRGFELDSFYLRDLCLKFVSHSNTEVAMNRIEDSDFSAAKWFEHLTGAESIVT